MLTALGKWIELGTHVRGAVRNGCSEVEIREALLQARYVPSAFYIWGLVGKERLIWGLQCLLRDAGWLGGV